MKPSVTSVGIAVLAAIAPLEASAASFSQLYVFGDSLSDSGNLYQSTFNLIPQSPPYAEQLTNGPLWVDYLAEDLMLEPASFIDVLVNPASTDSSDGINFAFGGASTGTGNILAPDLPVGALSQVSAFEGFVNTSLLQPAEDALYIYFAGSNDLAGSDVTPPQTELSIPLGDTKTALETLIETGAQNILVSNLPDFSVTPRFNQLPEEATAAISNQVTAYNQGLSATLDALATSNPAVNVIEFDFNGLLLDSVTHPETAGFTNVTDACLSDYTFPFDSNYTVCETPDSYLFWDDFHPTTQAHQVVATSAFAQLHQPELTAALRQPASVPEPGLGWGLLGFGSMVAVIAKGKRMKAESTP